MPDFSRKVLQLDGVLETFLVVFHFLFIKLSNVKCINGCRRIRKEGG